MVQTDEQKLLPLGETGFDSGFGQNESGYDYSGYNTDVDTESCYGKPERYDYSDIELPCDYYYDEGLLNEFNELAAKYNLSQKSANELMAVALKLSQLTSENCSKASAEQHRQKVLDYKRALINDRQLGAADFANTMKTANIAYSEFADEDVQRLLQETGLNCHPKIVRMFYLIGKNMQNDSFYGINSAPIHKESREDILFPTMQ